MRRDESRWLHSQGGCCGGTHHSLLYSRRINHRIHHSISASIDRVSVRTGRGVERRKRRGINRGQRRRAAIARRQAAARLVSNEDALMEFDRQSSHRPLSSRLMCVCVCVLHCFNPQRFDALRCADPIGYDHLTCRTLCCRVRPLL